MGSWEASECPCIWPTCGRLTGAALCCSSLVLLEIDVIASSRRLRLLEREFLGCRAATSGTRSGPVSTIPQHGLPMTDERGERRESAPIASNTAETFSLVFALVSKNSRFSSSEYRCASSVSTARRSDRSALLPTRATMMEGSAWRWSSRIQDLAFSSDACGA